MHNAKKVDTFISVFRILISKYSLVALLMYVSAKNNRFNHERNKKSRLETHFCQTQGNF